MFYVTYRNEDGRWFLEPFPFLVSSFWSQDRKDARVFLTRAFAEYVAAICEKRLAEREKDEWQARGKVHVIERKAKPCS